MKKNNKQIIYSIVICTYNGQKHITKCIESLLRQNFSKNLYEIIVVDDGSTDRTEMIVSDFPVTYVKHKSNKGIAAARNTGLKYVKGNIYICFDDDCVANRNWLKNIHEIYSKTNIENIAGVSGKISLAGKSKLIDKYMDKMGYGNPSPIIYGKSKHPLIRFYAYLHTMFIHDIKASKTVHNVNEIWGANCSFPVDILYAVNGWDNKTHGVEDTDLCNRIKNKFPNKKFICTKKAVLYHDHQLSLLRLIIKPYFRGPVILRFYLKNAKIPPIFPFPLVIIIASICFATYRPLYGILSFIVLPQVLYLWWLIKAIKNKKLYFLVFPYLQSGYELSTIAGLMKGVVYAK